MSFHTPGVYHVYNKGNNSQPIFFSDKHYLRFLEKWHKYIKPHTEILAWCLMPNHFHMLIEVTDRSLAPMQLGGNILPVIANGLRLLQSSHAKSINAEFHRTGSLFQQNTKARLIEDMKYALTAFWYIHHNPVAAGLSTDMQGYRFSSYQDYCGIRNGQLCNRQRALELLDMSQIDFTLPGTISFTPEQLQLIL